MEKFQIAKYGMMQVTAIVYGVLASGGCVKMWGKMAGDDYPKPAIYYGARFFHDYGLCLLLLVLGWTMLVSYLSSEYSPWDWNGEDLALSGLALAILLAVLSTFFVFGMLGAFSSNSI